MLDMDFIIETVVSTMLMVYYLVEGMVKAILPSFLVSQKSLNGEIALITGAGSGLGRSMAIRFAKGGSQVVLWDIDTKGNEETSSMIKEFGGKALSYTVDLTNREQVYAAAEKVREEVGDVTILVNNAGVVTGKRFLQCADKLIERSMAVNTNAHFWTVKAFLPSMMENDHGHVVSIASLAGLVGTVGLADYCASKFAAVGFMESLHLELRALHKNVETTTVMPFFINTGMFDGIRSRFPSILPIMEQEFAVDRIMEAIQSNQTVLYIPKLMYFLVALKGLLPVKAGLLLHRYFGTTASMDTFVGRKPSSRD